MKEWFKKIISVTLALLVLFSTMSFTVEKHICAGEVADISFTGNLERCVMPSDYDNAESLTKESCCKDEVHFVKSTNSDLTKVAVSKVVDVQTFWVYAYSYLYSFSDYTHQSTYFKDYSPPDISLDIQVSYQTFLI